MPSSFEASLFVIAIAAIVSFLSVVITNLVYAYKKRAGLHQQQLHALELQYEKNILTSKIEIQESVQQYIATEIHDHINLSLTLSKLYLNTIPWDQLPEAKTRVAGAIESLTVSIDGLQYLARTLNSDTLINNGLTAAIENETGRITRAGKIAVKYDLIGEVAYLSPKKELVLYRIVQESLNNIIKHANATEVTVELNYTGEFLFITIADNGKGISLDEIGEGKGSGLISIRRRAELLGGEMKIITAPGQGFTINLKIPVQDGK